MESTKQMLVLLLLGVVVAAHAVDKDVQTDLLMVKIVSLVTADRTVEALPFLAQLEGMGAPLSENLQLLYIDTLDRAAEPSHRLARSKVGEKRPQLPKSLRGFAGLSNWSRANSMLIFRSLISSQ